MSDATSAPEMSIGQRVLYRQYQTKRGPDGRWLVLERAATVADLHPQKWRSVKLVLDDPDERPRWVTRGCVTPLVAGDRDTMTADKEPS